MSPTPRTTLPAYSPATWCNVRAWSNSVVAEIPSAGTTTGYQRRPAEAAVCRTQMLDAVPTITRLLTPQMLPKKWSSQVP
jgi:hypothetical protein